MRVQRDGPGDQVGGSVVVSPLMGQDAEQVHGAGMGGLLFQEATIDGLGLRQPSFLVQSDAGGESLG